MVGLFHCSFLLVEDDGSSFVSSSLGIGLFSTSIYDDDAYFLGCVSYWNNNNFDGPFRAARAFGMLAGLATTITFVTTMVLYLVVQAPSTNVWKQRAWAVTKGLFFGAFLCELLTFVAFARDVCNNAETACRIGAASGLGILNLVLLLGQSAVVYILPTPDTPVLVLQVEDDHRSENAQPLSGNKDNRNIISGAEEKHPEVEKEQQSAVGEGMKNLAEDRCRRQQPHLTIWQAVVRRYHSVGNHSYARLLMTVTIVMSWVCSIIGVTGCTFFLVGATGQDWQELSGLGLFHRAYYKNNNILGCIAYSPSNKGDFDGPLQVGRAFGVLTLIFITICLVSSIALQGFFDTSRNKEKAWWLLVQLTLPVACLCQVITFATFQTESCTHTDSVACVPGTAGIFAILNVLLVFPLALFVFSLPCPGKPCFRVRELPPKSNIPSVIKSQVKMYKQFQLNQKQKKFAEVDADENVLPEPSQNSESHTLDLEECSETTDVVKCATLVERDDDKCTIRREVERGDGSKTITVTVKEYERSCATENPSRHPQQRNARVEGSASEEVSILSQTRANVWDRQVNLEQFEIVDLDDREPAKHNCEPAKKHSQVRGRPQESISRQRKSSPLQDHGWPDTNAPISSQQAVEEVAMSILREMYQEQFRIQKEGAMKSQMFAENHRTKTTSSASKLGEKNEDHDDDDEFDGYCVASHSSKDHG